MQYGTKYLFFFFLWSFTIGVLAQKSQFSRLKQLETKLIDFDSLHESKVMVLGTHHFSEKVLKTEHQESIHKLIELLMTFRPTKIVLELEPKISEHLNADYRKFLLDTSIINKKYNEVYQLGFRLAKEMGHDSLYLFDDQTEFIGSLTGFTFDKFTAFAKQNDEGFYNRFEKDIISNYDENQKTFQSGSLLNEVLLRNSPKAQKINAQRMHSYEVRVGIQKNWMGPDWLGRWYQRNVRMMANILKLNKPKDRMLIIVGDNHKWVLDNLFKNTPDFSLVSSWDFLIDNLAD